MRKHKNKYLDIKQTAEPLYFQPEISLILRFKAPTGRWQRIDLSFFEKGKFPRPRLGKEIAHAFQKLYFDSATGTRERFKGILNRFNEFLNWKASGNDSLNIDSLGEINFDLLLEYQAYLELITRL
jgi:hypothetical protein